MRKAIHVHGSEIYDLKDILEKMGKYNIYTVCKKETYQ